MFDAKHAGSRSLYSLHRLLSLIEGAFTLRFTLELAVYYSQFVGSKTARCWL